MSADELENRNFLARLVKVALAVALLVAVCAAPSPAQDDIAEAARQARERKAAQQNSPRHVYTDDDLKKTLILTPEDTARAVASCKVPATPLQSRVDVPAIEQVKQPEQLEQEPSSLGEIARRYRQVKEIKQVEQAARSGLPSRYPLDLPKTSFAEPKPIVAPSRGSLHEDELHTKKPEFPAVILGTAGTRLAPYAPHRDAVDRSFATAPLAMLIASLQRRQVLSGESWWRLAQRYLGSGARWPELMRVNPGAGRNPNRLIAGTSIFVPGGLKTAGPPGKEIAVRPGDTLWSVARDRLRCANAWPNLAAANPQVTNFHQLQIGTTLRLPETAFEACSIRVKADSRN